MGASPGISATTAMNWQWGCPTPKLDEPITILNALKPPVTLVIPTEREADLIMVNSLPQTGLNESQRLEIDLRDPEPQTITHSLADEFGLGTRRNVWTLALIPLFEIERVDRPSDGRNSFITTDSPTFQMGIPGVTMAKSGWKKLASWDVQGVGPLS